MKARRHLTSDEALAAAEALHVALLDGIARARRWARSELAFQGGTSLHLAYGSPRASEDLDFIVASDKGLDAVMRSAIGHARAFVRQAVGPDAELELKARQADPASGEPRNPRIFTVALRSPEFLESVKVRVEFWVATPAAAADYATEVRPARISQAALMHRPVRLAISQAILPTARLSEIFADKIHAVAGREYLKYRDIFDLWWLEQQGAALEGDALLEALAKRRALYPLGRAIDAAWADRMRARVQELLTPGSLRAFGQDMRRWLALGDGGMLSSPGHARTIAETAAALLLDAAALVEERRGAPRTTRNRR